MRLFRVSATMEGKLLPYPLPLSRKVKYYMARCLRERGFERQKMDERTKSVRSSIFVPVPRKMSELASRLEAIPLDDRAILYYDQGDIKWRISEKSTR